jgi:hypothetical protein
VPDNIPVRQPEWSRVEPRRRDMPRWRLRLAAMLEYLRRRISGRPAPPAIPPVPPRVRSLDEWRRLAAACWIDEGHFRVALLRARLRADTRTEAAVRQSVLRVVARAQRMLEELLAAQGRGDIDGPSSRPAEALLRSVVLAWEISPDELLDCQVVDRYRVPMFIDGGAVLPIEEMGRRGVPNRTK